ncbi:MAG: sigma-54-dependent Fis family transcriptional regulator [Nitrospira sp.]|nr:sigma-54-dependent Fis family transcriptional regulator [bacterium]MBL7049378.1 sigma-54-dependent Fis family transcriptional regulator [Nitrospira sp.]
MIKKNILIIDDDREMLDTYVRILENNHYNCTVTQDPALALEKAAQNFPDIVLTELEMPNVKGLEILKAIKNVDPSAIVIILTGTATIPGAVDAMKLGAFDYIAKPYSADELLLVLDRAFQLKNLTQENTRLRRDLSECHDFPNIIGESKQMGKIYETIEMVSKTDSSILITGENGTGKELIATTIHYQSKRKDEPLIRVNCAAFPENLVESELFGYDKGAFTGASQQKLGRFELADNGTIFLDEIGELPGSVQVKLLRVLQDGSFERLGGTKTIKVDVRVVSATNRDLDEDVRSGRFREDLFYRLNVIPVHMPSLKERKEDIPLLIEHFLSIYNCRFGRRAVFKHDAIMVLMEYEFPGNIRELGNIIERCITLSPSDTITKDELPPHIISKKGGTSTDTLYTVTAEAEMMHIKKILSVTKGKKTEAAEILGISRKNLWEKMKSYGL